MYDVILGCFLSFTYSYLIYPKKPKQKPRISLNIHNILHNSSIILPINNRKAIHFHHWLIFSIVIILFYVFNHKIPLFLFGFLIFMIIQGLCYNDCFEIICKNPYC